MSVTPDVSHAPRSWSKAEAEWNIRYIVVTPEVSHAPMSSLKDAAAKMHPILAYVPPLCVSSQFPSEEKTDDAEQHGPASSSSQ